MFRGRIRHRSFLARVLPLALIAGCAAQEVASSEAALVPAVTALPGLLSDRLVPVGASADRLDALLGSPDVIMRAGAGQWWRYRVGDYVLEVFVMDDPGIHRTVVWHVELRPQPNASAGSAAPVCQTTERTATTQAAARPAQVQPR